MKKGGKKFMKFHIKWFFVFILFAGILTGCNTEDGANDANDDLQNIGYGPGQNNQGDQNTNFNNQGRDRNDFPFFDGNTDDNLDFPYNTDRGYNHRNNEVEEDNRGQTTRDRQGQQGQQQENQPQAEQNGEAADQADTEQPQDVRQIVQEVVRLTNAEREKEGLNALEIDQELNEAAQAKSVDMADNGYFSHTSPTYGSPFEMLDQFGIDYTVAAENIAAGQHTAEEVVQQWMNSEGHRKNILNDSVTHIGIGYEPSGNMSPYWTQLFIAK